MDAATASADRPRGGRLMPELEQIRAAYESPSLPLRATCVLLGIAAEKIRSLAREHGWRPRTEGLERTPCERAIAVRAADAARQVELYGDAATVDDVQFLRQQGFIVHREGAGARVGNTLCSLAALRAKAARERRLIEAANSMPEFRHPPAAAR
jgi:hypothetical protein